MKIGFIVVLFVGALAFFGWRTTGYFRGKSDEAKTKAAQFQKAKLDAQKAQADEIKTQPVDKKGQTLQGVVPVDETTIGNYVFNNRVAPEPPQFLRSENTRLLVERDPVNNSWAWMGSQVLSYKIVELAKSYDVKSVEMDLEFVLVLVSTSKLRDRGISVFYDDAALWMNALSLDGDAGSLRISTNGFAMDLSFQDSKGGVSIVSQPVIRCVEAIPWEFATDTDVPVPTSDVVEGVIRQTVDYRSIGFGLKGVVRSVGRNFVLDVEQRNGSVVSRTTGANNSLPEFSNQRLHSTVNLGWWEWSVLGGIQIEKEELTRGLFRDRVSSSSDYLVIFVRPRLALTAPPKAVPVDQVETVHPLLLDPALGVLPPLSPEMEERAFIKDKLRERSR